MSARDDILKAVRANRAAPMELPAMNQAWQTFEHPLEHFRQVLTGIGGKSEILRDRAAADAWLNGRDDYNNSASAISLVEGVGKSTMELSELAEPHGLSQLDWAVLPGEFGVAENGAIWVTSEPTRHRAVYFLCEHLVLVLPATQVLHNMPQAYERIAGLGTGERPHFGVFIAGPSKTADIEQSLVIGAQGPRSLDVLLLEAE
jgi:L-lactate dehydrogenase complex protein LldG